MTARRCRPRFHAQSGHLCLATLHANNAYHALNRIINFFPLENRQLLYLDLAVALRAASCRSGSMRRPDSKRAPAVEILMNTRHISELIERGEINEIKEAMEQSLAPGCQTFEQNLFKLYSDGTISLEEALANADSPTNLHWLINNAQLGTNDQQAAAKKAPSLLDFERSNPDGASFQEFTLHVDRELIAPTPTPFMPQTPNPTLDLACELIARPSVTPEDAGCLELIAGRLQALGFTCERIDTGGVSNLWARRGQTGPVLFCRTYRRRSCRPARRLEDTALHAHDHRRRALRSRRRRHEVLAGGLRHRHRALRGLDTRSRRQHRTAADLGRGRHRDARNW